MSQLFIIRRQYVATLKVNQTTRWFDQAQEATAHSRLATARLANETKCLARDDLKSHSVDGAHDVVRSLHRKMFDEITHAYERVGKDGCSNHFLNCSAS